MVWCFQSPFSLQISLKLLHTCLIRLRQPFMWMKWISQQLLRFPACFNSLKKGRDLFWSSTFRNISLFYLFFITLFYRPLQKIKLKKKKENILNFWLSFLVFKRVRMALKGKWVFWKITAFLGRILFLHSFKLVHGVLCTVAFAFSLQVYRILACFPFLFSYGTGSWPQCQSRTCNWNTQWLSGSSQSKCKWPKHLDYAKPIKFEPLSF